MVNLTPLEDEEQEIVVQFLQLKGIPHFRVPNETYTTSMKQKAKNKALGVVSGVPDLFVLFEGHGLIAIEMKRIKGSVVSDAQQQWFERLNKSGIPAYICHGSAQAISIIEAHLKQLHYATISA